MQHKLWLRSIVARLVPQNLDFNGLFTTSSSTTTARYFEVATNKINSEHTRRFNFGDLLGINRFLFVQLWLTKVIIFSNVNIISLELNINRCFISWHNTRKSSSAKFEPSTSTVSLVCNFAVLNFLKHLDSLCTHSLKFVF